MPSTYGVVSNLSNENNHMGLSLEYDYKNLNLEDEI